MANILSLALRITGDASGVRLTPVERALQRLGEETDRVGRVFDRFADSSEAGQRAQQQFAEDSQRLTDSLRSGAINSQEFAEQFERLAEAANQEAAALERAARITEANITPLQRFQREQEELNEQLAAGRISQETYERALARAREQLERTSDSADDADSSIESLNRNVRILSTIEIGRAIIDGLQVITQTVSNVTTQLGSLVNGARDALDQVDKLSLRTGIGRDALQEYGVAAELSGVSVDELGATFQRLAANVGRANPPAELQQGLRQLNLNINDLRRLAPEEQFALIAQRISELPSATERAGAAFGVLGEQGVRLTSLLGQSGNAIEEVRQRTNRLGIVVSDQQIANVTRLNDTFTLVQRTVQGIVGQVVGNLAPAVTAVADQFLEFIETFEGSSGTGGTGIANAITTALLDAAEFFAGVFDSFVAQFSGFSVSLETAADVFYSTGQFFYGVFEGLRVIFNTFELFGNEAIIRLGKFLEGLGSWVSSDLQQAGRDLQAAGQAESDRNRRELEEAATNAANAFQNALTGESGSAVAAGEGAASQFIQGLRQKFEQSQLPEFQIATNLETSGARLTAFIESVGDGADQFYLDSVETLKVFQQQAAAGELTADQIQIMTSFTERLNRQLDQELAKRQEAAAAAAQQAEEVDKIVAASLEQIRIDEQFGGDSSRAKAADNVLKIQQEIVRVEEQLRAAREQGDSEAIAALSSRLSTLDQVKAREDDIATGVKKLNDDIAARQEELRQRQFDIDLARAEELANVRTGSIEINDIRSGGIAAFFDTLNEDPAISEAKKQTKELEKLRKEIEKLNAEKVDILEGTG